MILNNTYYQTLWEKFRDIGNLSNDFKRNSVCLSVKMILKHYQEKKPLHINFQNSKESISEIGRHLFIELANDIYLNHYDLPQINDGDRVKRRSDNQYYLVKQLNDNSYFLTQVLRKTKNEKISANIPKITYDRLVKGFVKVDSGVSERTIKDYFSFFETLNKDKSDFPRTKFEQKSVFISKKPLWDSLSEKNKIPSIYQPNPREESHLAEIRSIPALSDCIIYFTPKYEICYQNLLLKGEKIKAIIVFDTEADKIQQMLQDKVRFGFNLIIISNTYSPLKTYQIPCWNWYKEELQIIDDL